MFYYDVGGCFNALYRVHSILLIKIFLLLLLLLLESIARMSETVDSRSQIEFFMLDISFLMSA